MNEKSFDSLGLSPEMMRGIDDAGYTEMTDIQRKVIPLIVEGRDVIGQSSTGTGKTAAFGIPALEGITDTEQDDPQVLVLTPTRELAIQVSDELRKFSKYKEGVRVVTVYGGQNIDTQIRALRRAAVVVGTPGRIMDHMRRRTLKLGNVRIAVLDEADEMLDMGFLDDIRTILSATPDTRQTVLFSATMPAPILRITQRFQKNPEHIRGDDGKVAFDLISQYYIEVPKSKKAASVKLLFDQTESQRGLVFCNTKVMVDRLTRALTDMGLAAKGLHGDMRQGARTEVMKQFKDGTANILIATDVAARGIDASGLDIVINYDIPQDIEYYVHRIGRTGRAGKQGMAFTILTSSGDFFELGEIETKTGVRLRPYDLEGVESLPNDRISSPSTSRVARAQGGSRGTGGAPRRSGERGRSSGRDGERRGGRSPSVISVDVGSNHDITARHIAHAIIKNARIKKEDVGDITVKGDESLIELAPEITRHVMRSMEDKTISDFVVVFKIVRDEARGEDKPDAPVRTEGAPQESDKPSSPRRRRRRRK